MAESVSVKADKDVSEIYRKIWLEADRDAEEETKQFEKNPYEKLVRVANEEGLGMTIWRQPSRAEYKGEVRKLHILEMMELLCACNSKENNA